VGMGADVAAKFPAAAKLYEKANDVVGFDLRKVCFAGPAETLNTTTMSQPAIFVTSAALLEVFRTEPATANIQPDVTAGLSLGEYTALYAAGILSFEDGLRLVAERGRAMQAAADATKGGMVSILGLDEDKTRQLCTQAAEGELLEAVNFNCPGQIVVSGTLGACERAEKLAPALGAMKAVRLEVAGAFHTKMMAPAAERLLRALAECQVHAPAKVRTLANVDATYYESADDVRGGLTRQLTHAILWQKCMEKLLAEGFTSFYEIGPGRVLTGLMKRIDRKAKVINVSGVDSLGAVAGSK
jgi:[acyl-carrier-protein] S-malonyltransferase